MAEGSFHYEEDEGEDKWKVIFEEDVSTMDLGTTTILGGLTEGQAKELWYRLDDTLIRFKKFHDI